MAEARPARRRLVQALILAVAAVPLWHYLRPRRAPARRVLRVALADLPPEGAVVYREARVAVLRRDGAVFALDLACTHLGCTVTVTPRQLVCPCHGSTFALDGTALTGPATQPLARLEVRQGDGHVEVLL
jgi:cytochrome b6-f complex iron-sulfur subunit